MSIIERVRKKLNLCNHRYYMQFRGYECVAVCRKCGKEIENPLLKEKSI